MNKSLTIDYQEFALNELSAADRALVDEAARAALTAHNPYSNFYVGAALLLADGTVVRGSNQENIAYPSGLCAERTAMFAASAQHPGVAFDALAIVGGVRKGDSETLELRPASPCGACRQVMSEYEAAGGRKMRILLYFSDHKILVFEGVENLLPFVFAM